MEKENGPVRQGASNSSHLEAERERFLQTQRIAQVGYWEWDMQNYKIYWSDETYSILGYLPEEMTPTPDSFIKHVHPDDKNFVQVTLEKAIMTGKEYNIEHRFRKANGYEGWLSNRGRVFFENSAPVRMLGTFQDITERKHVERLLEEERNFISAVNNSIGNLVVVLDRAGKIIRFNQVCEMFTGLTFEDARHNYYWDIFCLPEEVELYKAFFSTLVPEKFPYEVENYQHSGDGSVRTVLWRNSVLLDQDGRVKNYIMTGSDITGRKETENALRELGERYRSLIHASPVAVISLDHTARIKSWSSAAEQVFGWKEREVLGKEVYPFLEEKSTGYYIYSKRILEKVLEGKSFSNLEYRCSGRDGSPVHINLSLAPLRSHAGEIEGIVLVAADHTARKVAEESLQAERYKALMIHKRSLPGEFPLINNIQLAAFYQPARDLRGDFYNVIKKGDKLIIYLADVAGQGLDGVMLSGFIREAIDNYKVTAGDEEASPEPSTILQYLTEACRRENSFIAEELCIFIAVLDLQTGEMRYTSSGFCLPPVIVPTDGDPLELEIVNETGDFSERDVLVAPGFTLFLSTDGLVGDREINDYYKIQLKNVFSEYRHLPPELISRTITGNLAEHDGNACAKDDIAFLVLQALEKDQCMSLEVESDFAVIADTVDKVLAFIHKHATADTDLLDFHELLVNAVEHGNKRDGAKKVAVDVIANKHYYKIVISDQGDGFDWRERMEKELDMDNYFERGRGIIMTRMMSDYLGYNERGNRVTLIKRV